MAYEIGLYTIPPLIGGLISAVIGIFVLYKNPKEKASRIFFLLMVALTIWLFGELLMHASTDQNTALGWGKTSNIGFILVPIFLLHFTLIYPKPIFSEKNLKILVLMYVPVIFIIVLMVATNSMFTVASTSHDFLIDGNGDNPGRGDFEFPEYPYEPLMKYELGLWFYIDENNNTEFDVINDTSEDLRREDVMLVGDGLNLDGTPGNWVPLENANNSGNIYWVDIDETEVDHAEHVYDHGEDIYLDSGDEILNPVIKGDETDPWGNYDYVPMSLYLLLILFFFIYIFAAIANLINQYLKLAIDKEKKQTAYLSIGLIFIIVFIISYNFLGPYVSVAILDSILTVTIAFFFAVAVLKYNLMDIQVIIKRSIFFSIIFMTIAIIFVVVGEVIEYLIGELIEGTIEIVTNIISALMVSVMFLPVTKYVRKFTDMLFPEARKYEQEYKNRMSAYGATLEAMWADGSISDKEADALRILREKLELTEDDHYRIERKYRKHKRF
jgi:hypothetical protein